MKQDHRSPQVSTCHLLTDIRVVEMTEGILPTNHILLY